MLQQVSWCIFEAWSCAGSEPVSAVAVGLWECVYRIERDTERERNRTFQVLLLEECSPVAVRDTEWKGHWIWRQEPDFEKGAPPISSCMLLPSPIAFLKAQNLMSTEWGHGCSSPSGWRLVGLQTWAQRSLPGQQLLHRTKVPDWQPSFLTAHAGSVAITSGAEMSTRQTEHPGPAHPLSALSHWWVPPLWWLGRGEGLQRRCWSYQLCLEWQVCFVAVFFSGKRWASLFNSDGSWAVLTHWHNKDGISASNKGGKMMWCSIQSKTISLIYHGCHKFRARTMMWHMAATG